MRWPGRCDDRGAATVLVTVLIAATVVTAGVVVEMARAVAVRHLTAAIADAAALAAAAHASAGEEAACAAAVEVGRRDDAVVTRCALDGSIASVAVRLERAPPLLWALPTLNSRAGPAETNQ